ncbi:hypothetical protein [Pseudomonas koreensis]|uniref:hypothetical protein n=1 Tax=Pseudomonas koreensis TaxID=198620 RepID=UPI0018E6D8A7|nr:hypothetical protein [Pseudomonas koreensis]MBI6948556.1 hypothetical protein [Pseudomonas koreensis]
MRDYSDLKFQAQALCQRSNAVLDLIAENELLARENEAFRQDAERYRWIRVPNRPATEFDSAFDEFGVPIDSVIDEAISKEALRPTAAKIVPDDDHDGSVNDAPAHLVQFEIPQMWKAVLGEPYTMPEGMTRKEFREWMLQKACSLSWPARLKEELKALHLENAALRDLPMIVVNEYTQLAFAAKGLKTSDRYIQKANGAMDVHQRMKKVKV